MIFLVWLLGLICLVMFVLVLIRQFKEAGAVHGIIGIITCTIWTFIWGWMNAGRLNIRNLMLIWTAALVLDLILQALFGASMMRGMMPVPTATP